MKHVGKSFGMISLMVIALVLSSCSSSQKKGQMSDDQNMEAKDAEMGSSSGLDVELYADSDSKQAGSLQSVYFPFDSSVITAASKEMIESNANFLKDKSSIKIQIEGHCDERGGVEYNLALGQRRAESIKKYMMALGIDENRLSTVSYGKERPVAFGHDEDSWGLNRRGNFVVVDK